MDWILVVIGAGMLLYSHHLRHEVVDGIQHDRRASVIADDAVGSGLFAGIGFMLLLIGLNMFFNWVNL